jgi:hypothetical protein
MYMNPNFLMEDLKTDENPRCASKAGYFISSDQRKQENCFAHADMEGSGKSSYRNL